MADTHKAILALYSDVVSVNGDYVAYDQNGTLVNIDQSAVDSWVDPNAYVGSRVSEYPRLEEQLDLLYKDMIADKGDKSGAWFAAVKAVKDKYPKE